MGTRSITRIHNGNKQSQVIACIYRQYDGYPEGNGEDLKHFSEKFKIVNGFKIGEVAGTHANGMGCFAMQLIKHLKDEIGNFYLYPADAGDEEYNYEVYEENGYIHITVREEGSQEETQIL